MTRNPTIQPLCTTCLRRTGCINVTDDHSGCLHYSPVSGAARPTVCDLGCKFSSGSFNGCSEWARVESCEKWQHLRGAKAETVAAGGMIREVEEVVAKGPVDRCRELVEPHIAYTVGILKVHGVAQELIDATAHTYREAWLHSWRHCLEECGVARVEGGNA